MPLWLGCYRRRINAFQGFLVVGGAGLVLGAWIGFWWPSRRVLLWLTAAVALLILFLVWRVDAGSGSELDEVFATLAIVALFANLAGWVIGLGAGAFVSVRRRRR